MMWYIFGKITGVVLFLAGLVLTYKPSLWSKALFPVDNYEMIEIRVKWGFLIGLGVFLIFFEQWTFWKPIVFALLFFLTLGIIAARLYGLVFDGYYSKQVLWLILEFFMLILFFIFYKYATH